MDVSIYSTHYDFTNGGEYSKDAYAVTGKDKTYYVMFDKNSIKNNIFNSDFLLNGAAIDSIELLFDAKATYKSAAWHNMSWTVERAYLIKNEYNTSVSGSDFESNYTNNISFQSYSPGQMDKDNGYQSYGCEIPHNNITPQQLCNGLFIRMRAHYYSTLDNAYIWIKNVRLRVTYHIKQYLLKVDFNSVGQNSNSTFNLKINGNTISNIRTYQGIFDYNTPYEITGAVVPSGHEWSSTTGKEKGTITADTTLTLNVEKHIYILYDTVFNYQKWRDDRIKPGNLCEIPNITNTGFTIKSLDNNPDSSKQDGFSNSSPLYEITPGEEYTFSCKVVGSGYEIYVFLYNEKKEYVDFINKTESNFNIKIPNNIKYINFRVDANKFNNVCTFSDFVMYPSNRPYMYYTVPNAEQRTSKDSWRFPVIPELTGYTFQGWYSQPGGLGTKISDGTNVLVPFPFDDIMVWSHFTPRQYTVTFNTDGGTPVPNQIVNYDTTCSYPSIAPTKSNYRFDKWYKDSNFQIEFNFQGDKIVENTTIYAKWVPLTYTLNLRSSPSDGGVLKVLDLNETIIQPDDKEDNPGSSMKFTLPYGTKVIVEAIPKTDKGYYLEEWSDKNLKTLKEEITVTDFEKTYIAYFKNENGIKIQGKAVKSIAINPIDTSKQEIEKTISKIHIRIKKSDGSSEEYKRLY